MKRILLIKLTSFGDLLHALPALNDAYQADPTVQFDWAIDQQFSEVAGWHPAVQRIFRTSHRNWRKNLSRLSTYRSIKALIQEMRKTKYDLVIDGQGNFKSALLSCFARGTRVGFDRDSAREWIAHIAYQTQIAASRKAHAIDRLRILFAHAIGYPLPTTPPNFSLKEGCFVKPAIDLPESYLVFVHNAAWATKLWPEEHWKELIARAVQHGLSILLPWGNLEEKGRAERLAGWPKVQVLPRLSLSEIGYVLKGARAAVCMDTGLSHLAAALEIPSITLYGATDSGLIGASGRTQSHLQSTFPCAPCNRKICTFKDLNPPCLAQITPETVLRRLLKILDSKYPNFIEK
ncbi:MAG: lipopolysaccharide heptosyltransferase I [Chlamydiales bacterium]